MGRIPLSEIEVGYWVRSSYDKNAAHFVPLSLEWYAKLHEDHRIGTWEDFKKAYPYRSCNIKWRYKECPRWALPFN